MPPTDNFMLCRLDFKDHLRVATPGINQLSASIGTALMVTYPFIFPDRALQYWNYLWLMFMLLVSVKIFVFVCDKLFDWVARAAPEESQWADQEKLTENTVKSVGS